MTTPQIPVKLSLEQASEFYTLDVSVPLLCFIVKTSSIYEKNLRCIRVNNVRWLLQLDFDIHFVSVQSVTFL